MVCSDILLERRHPRRRLSPGRILCQEAELRSGGLVRTLVRRAQRVSKRGRPLRYEVRAPLYMHVDYSGLIIIIDQYTDSSPVGFHYWPAAGTLHSRALQIHLDRSIQFHVEIRCNGSRLGRPAQPLVHGERRRRRWRHHLHAMVERIGKPRPPPNGSHFRLNENSVS